LEWEEQFHFFGSGLGVCVFGIVVCVGITVGVGVIVLVFLVLVLVLVLVLYVIHNLERWNFFVGASLQCTVCNPHFYYHPNQLNDLIYSYVAFFSSFCHCQHFYLPTYSLKACKVYLQYICHSFLLKPL